MLDAAYLSHRYRTEFEILEVPKPVRRLLFPVIARDRRSPRPAQALRRRAGADQAPGSRARRAVLRLTRPRTVVGGAVSVRRMDDTRAIEAERFAPSTSTRTSVPRTCAGASATRCRRGSATSMLTSTATTPGCGCTGSSARRTCRACGACSASSRLRRRRAARHRQRVAAPSSGRCSTPSRARRHRDRRATPPRRATSQAVARRRDRAADRAARGRDRAAVRRRSVRRRDHAGGARALPRPGARWPRGRPRGAVASSSSRCRRKQDDNPEHIQPLRPAPLDELFATPAPTRSASTTCPTTSSPSRACDAHDRASQVPAHPAHRGLAAPARRRGPRQRAVRAAAAGTCRRGEARRRQLRHQLRRGRRAAAAEPRPLPDRRAAREALRPVQAVGRPRTPPRCASGSATATSCTASGSTPSTRSSTTRCRTTSWSSTSSTARPALPLDRPAPRAARRAPVVSVPVLHERRGADARASCSGSSGRRCYKTPALARAPRRRGGRAAGSTRTRVAARPTRPTLMEGLYVKVEEGGEVVGRYKWVRPASSRRCSTPAPLAATGRSCPNGLRRRRRPVRGR